VRPGPPDERPRGGRDLTGREHDQEPALAQPLQGVRPGPEIGLGRRVRAGEIDRQQIGPDLGRAVEGVVGQDFEVGPDLGDEIANDQPVEDPERMVRGDHDWAVRRDRRETLRIVVDPQLQSAHRSLPEAFAGAGTPQIVDIDTLEAGLPGQTLDGSNGQPAEQWIFGRCVAEQQPIPHARLVEAEAGANASGGA
jgi:hypothetical protein